jgi:hypothetical protein
MIGKGSVDSTHPEWAIDALGTPGANVQTEGDEFSFAAVTPVVRVGNYTQIFRKDFIVSETQEAIKNAGDSEKTKRNIIKKGIDIRKDVEYSIVSNVGSVAGAARVSGGLPSWLTTNVERHTGGTNGGFQQSGGSIGLTLPSGDATPTSRRAFTKSLMDLVAAKCYSSGADVRSLVVSPYIKSVFVSFMSDPAVATFRYNADKSGPKTLVSNADIYEGPYGTITVKPNRVMAPAVVSRNAFFIDPDMMSWEWLRKIHKVPDVAVTSDAKKTVLIGEGCLKVDNEAAHGVVADIYGTSATT